MILDVFNDRSLAKAGTEKLRCKKIQRINPGHFSKGISLNVM